jgi:hypothetical protein
VTTAAAMGGRTAPAGFSVVRWVLATTLGLAVGLFFLGGIYALLGLRSEELRVPYVLHPMGWLPMLGGIAVMALAQQRVMRSWVGALPWIGSTVLGFALSIALQDLLFVHPQLPAPVLALLTGASIGAVLGAVQFPALRRTVTGPVAWIPLNAVTIGLASMGVTLVSRGPTPGSRVLLALPFFVGASVVLGLFLKKRLVPREIPPPA